MHLAAAMLITSQFLKSNVISCALPVQKGPYKNEWKEMNLGKETAIVNVW